MSAGGDTIDRLAAGGRPVGYGIVAFAGVRLFIFIFNWLAGRYDARQDRLERREQRLDQRYDARLRHLEKEVGRIHVLEQVISILAAELRQLDPANEKLGQVARLLRKAIPVDPKPKSDFNDLLGKMK